MPTITLTLPPETESTLRRKAASAGETLEAFLQRLAEQEARAVSFTPIRMSHAEFERRLNALSDGLPPMPPLPEDMSRAWMHGEHD